MKPKNWIRPDLQEIYNSLCAKRIPLMERASELDEAMRNFQREKGRPDVGRLEERRAVNTEIDQINREKEEIWTENCNSFRNS
jgi:hypothetical protein